MVLWVGPLLLLLSGCRGWTTAQGSQGRRGGPSFSGHPILRTGWGRNAWKACRCRGGAGLSPVPEPPTTGGVGTAKLAFRGRGEG